MKRREARNLAVTCCFLAVLTAFIAAGLVAEGPAEEHAAARSVEQRVWDAQFAQYLEYRARLESSVDCQ